MGTKILIGLQVALAVGVGMLFGYFYGVSSPGRARPKKVVAEVVRSRWSGERTQLKMVEYQGDTYYCMPTGAYWDGRGFPRTPVEDNLHAIAEQIKVHEEVLATAQWQVERNQERLRSLKDQAGRLMKLFKIKGK